MKAFISSHGALSQFVPNWIFIFTVEWSLCSIHLIVVVSTSIVQCFFYYGMLSWWMYCLEIFFLTLLEHLYWLLLMFFHCLCLWQTFFNSNIFNNLGTMCVPNVCAYFSWNTFEYFCDHCSVFYLVPLWQILSMSILSSLMSSFKDRSFANFWYFRAFLHLSWSSCQN